MQHYTRLAVTATLAFLMVTSYMMSDPPFTAVMNLFGISSDSDLTSEFRYINESSERVQDGYLVWSSGCRIVDVPAWDKSIKGLVGTKNKVSCPGKRLSKVTGPIYNRTLEISPALLTTSCCLRQITRQDNTSSAVKTPDDIYKISNCQHVNLTVTLPEDAQFIWVKCTKKGKTEREVYSNMHSFVGKTPVVEEKLKKQTDQFKAGKMSVLLIGIDSISRLNLIRTMPKTVKYLNNNGWLDLQGYNKVDDNTFPNLMAILTGKTVAQVRSACWPSRASRMDNCPFIWKDYSEKGYITAYAEDEPSISTFNYHKKGFAQSPTDYYLRPFMLAAETRLKTKMTTNGLHLCTGPNYSIDFILDYAVDFVRVFQNALYFALFWMNSFSHNDVNMPAAFDDRILKFLRDIEKSGTLNSTLVVFLSDHGMRFGKIRETFVGWLEERLPFIYFWVPKSFKNTYPDKYENLITNRNRLSSPFDLHLTLKELVEEESEGAQGCDSCNSLMKEVQWNRTCEEAGIGGHWCTCSEYKNLSPQGANVDKMAQSVVDFINSVVVNAKDKLKASTKCAPLKLSRVLSFRTRVPPGPKQVVILLETKPGGALFEATLAPDQTPLIVDTISRINSYSRQSYCVDDAYLKKYCYCQTTHR